MKVLIFLALAYVASGSFLASVVNEPHLEEFVQFVGKYQKAYVNDEDELLTRFKIFQENMDTIQVLQAMEQGTATYGANEFADLTPEEFRGKHTSKAWPTSHPVPMKSADMSGLKDAPASFDWRTLGAVTPVKNQQQCGSCWSFSTTGNVEGQWFIKKNKLISLSEQQLVDCDKVDQGCEGGLPSQAYTQIIAEGGLVTEADYPYTAADGTCSLKKSEIVVFINGSVTLPTDEGQLATWLAANGPISIGINANAMQWYTGGVAHPIKLLCSPNSLDHGVLLVGYGTDGTKPYWIVKNSWGATWGESGYYRVFRGAGVCGLNLMATSSTVA